MLDQVKAAETTSQRSAPGPSLYDHVMAQASRPSQFGVDMNDAQIPPDRPNEAVTASPPTYEQALHYRQGQICDKLAGFDRWIFRALQAAADGYAGHRWAVHLERRTAQEAALLAGIDDILPVNDSVHQMGNFGATREQMQALLRIEQRGRLKSLATVGAVTGGNFLIDQVLFPADHIRSGTLIGDLGGLGLMCARMPWTYRAAAMVGSHILGRICDHFMQGDEPTNAHLSIFNPSSRLANGLRAF